MIQQDSLQTCWVPGSKVGLGGKRETSEIEKDMVPA